MSHTIINFLIFCSGANRELLQHVPNHVRRVFVSIGCIILIPMFTSFIGITYLLYQTSGSVLISMIEGFFWSLIIFNLNRSMVFTHKAARSLIFISFQIFISIFISVVISISLLLFFFKADLTLSRLSIPQTQGFLSNAINALFNLLITNPMYQTISWLLFLYILSIELLPVIHNNLSSESRKYYEWVYKYHMLSTDNKEVGYGNTIQNAETFQKYEDLILTKRSYNDRSKFCSSWKPLAVLFSPLNISMLSGGALFGYAIDPFIGSIVGACLGLFTGIILLANKIDSH